MIIKKKRRKENDDNEKKTIKPKKKAVKPEVEDGLFSAFDNIEERAERRRGDRRRGYRRVDDRNLVSRAEEEAFTIKEKSAKEGFDSGIQHATQEIQNLRAAIQSLITAKEDAYQQYQRDIAFIAIKVAEKIIKTEIASDETIVLNIIAEVLKEVGKGESRIIIKTNPIDTELVRSKISEIISFGFAKTDILVEDDDNIECGFCIVETSSGQIDASFKTQIDIIQKALDAGL